MQAQLTARLQENHYNVSNWQTSEINDIILDRPTEPTTGPLADLIRDIATRQPTVIVIDEFTVSETILGLLTSSPATRRLPQLVWRSEAADLDSVLIDIRSVVNTAAAIKTIDCQRPLLPEALEGIKLFNAGQYYKAHDPLEEAWNQEETPDRDLYRALLQVSVAYHHCERGNYRGAVKLLLRAKQWLAKLPDQCRGVEIGQFRKNALEVEAHLLELGSDNMAAFETSRIAPIQFRLLD